MSDIDSFGLHAKGWDAVPGRAERAAAVAIAIREQVRLSTSMTALEYGCGTGLLSFALQSELGQITLVDSSDGMLAVLREKIAAGGIANMAPLKLDLAIDPLPAQRFDLIYTLMTLHHIQDTNQILGCFHSLLNPGGTLCIADLDKEDGSFHSEDPAFHGHNGFPRFELQQTLTDLSFAHIRIRTCYEILKNGRRYPLFLARAVKK